MSIFGHQKNCVKTLNYVAYTSFFSLKYINFCRLLYNINKFSALQFSQTGRWDFMYGALVTILYAFSRFYISFQFLMSYHKVAIYSLHSGKFLALFFCRLPPDFFSKSTFSKNSFKNTV